ncbi:hypothetical protein QFZ76_005399 [Streptomyces sp. V4I2]|nr:hypothetical protein [Streptomyces sp. V4I2]
MASSSSIPTGVPTVKDAVVVVTDVRGDLLATRTTGEQGEFAFAELTPGPVTLAVNAAGHRPRALAVEIGGTGVTRVEVDLDTGARLQGVVRAPHGPLAVGEYTVIATGYPPAATALTVKGRGGDDHAIELGHSDA